MNRREFIDGLQQKLTKIPRQEREEAVNYYEELLNDMNIGEGESIPSSWPGLDQIAEDIMQGIPYSASEEAQSTEFDMIPITEIKDLDVKMRLGSIEIEYADVEQAQLKQPLNAVGQEINYQILFSIQGNKLFLRDEYENNYLSRLNRINLPPAILRLPRTTFLENLTIDTKMGKTKIFSLQCKSMSIVSGMGAMYLQNVQAQKAEIRVQMGSMKLEKCRFYGSRIQAEMGSIQGDAIFMGYNRLQTDMGSIRLKLRQNRADCSVQARANMGSVDIRINGRNINIPEQVGQVFNSNMELISSMGSIYMDFIGEN